MPEDRNHVLLIGDSGTGKTGALVSLIDAGYKLYMLDLENGSRILRNLVRHYCPDKMDNLHIEKVKDIFKFTETGASSEKAPRALSRIGRIIDKWQKEVDEDDIIVVDTLTALGRATFRWAKAQNKLIRDVRHHYRNAQEVMEPFMETLTSDQFPCHTISLTHITYKDVKKMVDGKEQVVDTKCYPSAIGEALGSRLSAHFNNTFQTRRVGVGKMQKRVISSVGDGTLDLKNTSPFSVEAQYPIHTGLATLFKLL